MTLCFNMLFALIMISYKNMKVKRKALLTEHSVSREIRDAQEVF